ncbi:MULTISPECIES: hypothetical protein [Streptomyces]|uniref:hypothetical protein n=1 Tax=Streptomyces TaxID=1883 RepID=UPI00068FC6E9|nr:hypothetical protein [Streptomyces sp. NRRL F-5193]
MAGIALPLLGIVASLVVGMDRDDASPTVASPPSSSASSDSVDPASSEEPEPEPTGTTTTPASDDKSAAPPLDPPDSPLPSGSGASTTRVDLAPPRGHGPARESSWGLTPAPCTNYEQQLIDLDTGLSRVEKEDNGRIGEPGGAELHYWPDTCTGGADYRLRGVPNTRVGLLRADAPHTAEQCRKVSNTGLPPLDLNDSETIEQAGFVVGAAICSVTTEGSVAMATIDHISDGGIGGEATASGTLYVWPETS